MTDLSDLLERTLTVEIDSLIDGLLDYGISPMHLPVPVGHPLDHEYQACLWRLSSVLQTSDPEEVLSIQEHLDWDLQEHGDLASAVIEQTVRDRYRSFGSDPRHWATGSEGTVFQTHPGLRKHLDDDGLLRVDGLDAQPATIFHGDSALHYHPFLRRHFTSHINQDLIGTLLRQAGRPENHLRIAIDSEHHRPAAYYEEYLERDYWYGPPLSVEKLDDPHYVGVTVHGDPETGLTHEYPRLFVSWALDREGNKVIQIEELSDHQSAQQGGLRLLRYLHAIRDLKRRVFIHCDGAVRAYTAEAYASRRQKDYVTGRQSATRYRKLFRIDGAITADEWSEVTVQWFRHNRLILEYLRSLSPEDDGSADD